jgi:hypothetical protein
MDDAHRCPECRQFLHLVLAPCYCWTPGVAEDSFLSLGVEALYKCAACGQTYFSDELALLQTSV